MAVDDVNNRDVRHGDLLKGAGWMFAGQLTRLALNLVYFVLIARALGPSEFGAFVAVTAATSLIAPFVGVGMPDVLVRESVRDPARYPVLWGGVIKAVVANGLVLAMLGSAAAILVLGKAFPPQLVVAVAVADLVFVRLTDAASKAALARYNVNLSALIFVVLGAAQCLAAIATVSLADPDVITWGWFYFGGAACAATVSLAAVFKRQGLPTFSAHTVRQSRQLNFSIAGFLQAVNSDIDKVALGRLSGLAATGAYGAAYRIIDASYVPIRSFLYSAYPRFFSAGSSGLLASRRFAHSVMPWVVLYGMVLAAGLLLCAGLVPLILGSDYEASVAILRWLAVLPLLRATSAIGADALSGSGHQGQRTVIQAVVAGCNLGMCLWLIPVHSWHGAAWASIASETLFAAAIWGYIQWQGNRDEARHG